MNVEYERDFSFLYYLSFHQTCGLFSLQFRLVPEYCMVTLLYVLTIDWAEQSMTAHTCTILSLLVSQPGMLAPDSTRQLIVLLDLFHMPELSQMPRGKTPIVLKPLSNGELGLESAFTKQDGSPRFVIPMPNQKELIEKDAGLVYLMTGEQIRGGCESLTRTFFDAHLQPGDSFVDVGAHWGLFSLTAATRFPGQISVLAIEAHPYNASRLATSVNLNQLSNQVEIVHCAIGDRAGTVKLVDGFGSMGHSIDGHGHPNRQPGAKELTIPMLSVDHLVAERESLLENNLFLKVDVEGFECEVIAGAGDLLSSGKVAALVLEKGTTFGSDEGLLRFSKTLEFLRAIGYRTYTMRKKPEGEGYQLREYELEKGTTDVVCIRKDVEPLATYQRILPT